MVAAIESLWGHLLPFLSFGVPQFGRKDRPPLVAGSVFEVCVVEACTAGTSRDQDGTVRQDGGVVLSACERHGLLGRSPLWGRVCQIDNLARRVGYLVLVGSATNEDDLAAVVHDSRGVLALPAVPPRGLHVPGAYGVGRAEDRGVEPL